MCSPLSKWKFALTSHSRRAHKPISLPPSRAPFSTLVLRFSIFQHPEILHLLRSAGDLPGTISVYNNLRAREKALAELLCCGAAVQASLPLRSPPPLLNESVAGLAKVAHLVVFHALQPVAEAGTDEAVDGVGEEALAVEEGAHLDAELP
jgi:hypothetical protein